MYDFRAHGASSKLAIESGSRVNSVTAQFPPYVGVAASTDTEPATAKYFACLSRCYGWLPCDPLARAEADPL